MQAPTGIHFRKCSLGMPGSLTSGIEPLIFRVGSGEPQVLDATRCQAQSWASSTPLRQAGEAGLRLRLEPGFTKDLNMLTRTPKRIHVHTHANISTLE